MKHRKKMGSRAVEVLGPHSSFLGLHSSEADLENARAVIISAPFDGTTTYRAGTREGPRAILAASRELEFFDEETLTEACREGIFTLEELPVNVSSPRDMVEDVRRACEWVIGRGKLPVLLGGEHLMSLGMIEALAGKFSNLKVLHLDAHCDLRSEYQGSSYSNACVMRLALDRASIVQVGIRSLTKEEYEFVEKRQIPCFFAHRLHRDRSLWERIREHVAGSNLYISIDLDVFDPSIVPAVGTPEPGGLGWYETLDLLKKIIGFGEAGEDPGAGMKRANIVGFDIMELLPVPPDPPSEFLAAKLLYKMLSYFFMREA